MPETLVSISGATVFYPGLLPRVSILKNIDWEIRKGEHCALEGPNGAGKSSLLKLIHGNLWPATGTVQWRDEDGYSASPITAKNLTGIVSPQIQANCQLQAWNIRGCDILAGASANSPFSYGGSDENRKEAETLMSDLGAPECLTLRLPELSQGQLRLILLAREFLRKPQLLLLDEWSDGLDQEKRKRVLAKLDALSTEITMIFAAHKQDSVPEWVKAHKYLKAGEFCEKPEPALHHAQMYPNLHPPTKDAAPIFELKNVSVYINSKPVLWNLNWLMRQGENWQICGPNGSGKSTFLRLLAGDEFIYAGGSLEFWPKGASHPLKMLAEKRRAISLVSDLGQALYDHDLTALELILSGLDNTIGLYRDFSPDDIAWATSLLNWFFPKDSEKIAVTSIQRLSSGQLRRLFLARALINRPEVLLLDEPLSNLDKESEATYLNLLARIIDTGVDGIRPQIVIVSHQRLPNLCNRHATLERGKLVE